MHCSKQCTPNINKFYHHNLLTDKKLDHISIQYGEITSLIRNLNPSKSTGSDGISVQMLLLCDNSVAIPLKIIFQNILASSTCPDMRKHGNVTPIFKKGDKPLIKNYRPISLLPICGKIFENIISNNLYSYLNEKNLITKINKVFVQAISYFGNEIHKDFEDSKSLEVRAVFLYSIINLRCSW